MARYKIAMNESYFDSLLTLLDCHSEVGLRTQELIQLLVTNPIL